MGIRGLSLEAVLDWYRKAGQVASSRGWGVTSRTLSTALREIGAPFHADTMLRKWGLYISDIVTWLQGEGPRPVARLSTRSPVAAALVADTSPLFPSLPKGIDGAEVWDRLAGFQRTQQSLSELATNQYVDLPGDGPIGIIMCGDAHIGSRACDYGRLKWVASECRRVPNLYAIQIGDLIDSMIWPKVRFEARGVPADVPEELHAAAHWIRSVGDNKLLGLVAGNHDLVSEKMAGLPHIEFVLHVAGARIPYNRTELVLNVKVGQQPYVLVMRHKFRGKSQFNPAHGALRWHLFHDMDIDADLAVGGHTHASGYVHRKMKGRLRHAINLGAYKIWDGDEYAREEGFPNENLSPDMVAVLRHDRREIQVFTDSRVGIQYLESLGSSKAKAVEKVATRRSSKKGGRSPRK
jgi:hypothetical protein